MSNLKLINMRDVEVEPICWLWYPFIPYGKVTIIQGDPGEGKTTLVLQIIARLTKGESIIDENKKPLIEKTVAPKITARRQPPRFFAACLMAIISA